MARSGLDVVPFGIAVVAGVLSWDLVRLIGDQRDIWQDTRYWLVGYPLMLVAAFLLGLGFPERPWRWAVVIVAAQAVWMIFLALAAGDAPNLLQVFVPFALLGLPLLLATYAGQWLRHRLPE